MGANVGDGRDICDQISLTKYRNYAIRMAHAINNPMPSPDRVMFVPCVGDEASLALGMFQAFQYAMGVLIAATLTVFLSNVTIYDWAKQRHVLLTAAVYVPIVVGMANYFYNSTNVGYVFIPFLCVLVVSILLLLLMFMLGILVFLMGLASVLVGILPFGWHAAVGTLWMELCVEISPPGRWHVFVLEPGAPASTTGLRHGFGYQSEYAIRVIVDRIRHPFDAR